MASFIKISHISMEQAGLSSDSYALTAAICDSETYYESNNAES